VKEAFGPTPTAGALLVGLAGALVGERLAVNVGAVVVTAAWEPVDVDPQLAIAMDNTAKAAVKALARLSHGLVIRIGFLRMLPESPQEVSL
jgi:xanthosine utilization system XapX-like protein